MKANLKITIPLIFILSALTTKSQCLNAWKYYIPITVTNNISASLTDYQVKVIVNTASPIAAGKMISTGDDIRFIDLNSCSNLNYWIESGINTSNTIIWVKLNTLQASAGKTILMYYGNSSAS